MGVQVEITGADELQQKLLALDARFNEPARPLFEQIAEEWNTDFKENIRNQGAESPFAPLAPATRRLRAELGYGAGSPILQRTGDLLASIGTLEMTDDSLSVGSQHASAALLHFGGTTSPGSAIPNASVPARPFIVLLPQTIEDTMTMVEVYYMGEDAGHA